MKLLNEGNQLKQMATYNKKRQKGMSPFMKLDAGDVEHNQAFFNNAMGNSNGGECMAESFEDEIEVNKLEGSFSMEIDEAQDVFDLDAAEMAIEAAYEDGDISEEGYNLLMEEADEKRKELESEEDDSMTEDINKSKKIIKEDQQGLLPAWSQESAEVTNNSLSSSAIVRQAMRSFTAKHATRSRYTFDNGAAILKSFSDDEEDEQHTRVPQGAYCCITHYTIHDFYYEVKVPCYCYVWNGKYWYRIDFEKESEEGLCLDKVFGKDIYNELYEYFKERADSAEDKYDINSAFYELADISDKIPYTLNNELFDYLEQKDIEIRAAAKEDPDENEEPIEESIEEIEADEKKVEPQTIDIRKALNDIDMNSMTTDFVNMYEAARLSLEDKQKLALMLAKGEDLNAIYDFLASKLGDGYLHSESHVIDENKENK